MSHVGAIVQWPLCNNFNINAVHFISIISCIADSISQKRRQGFKLLGAAADQLPFAVHIEFLNLLPAKWSVY